MHSDFCYLVGKNTQLGIMCLTDIKECEVTYTVILAKFTLNQPCLCTPTPHLTTNKGDCGTNQIPP